MTPYYADDLVTIYQETSGRCTSRGCGWTWS